MNEQFVSVNNERLTENINEISSELRSMETEINGIYEQIVYLNSMWDGPANALFNISFNNDSRDVLDALAKMSKFIDSLDECRKKYDECEMSVMDEVSKIN